MNFGMNEAAIVVIGLFLMGGGFLVWAAGTTIYIEPLPAPPSNISDRCNLTGMGEFYTAYRDPHQSCNYMTNISHNPFFKYKAI